MVSVVDADDVHSPSRDVQCPEAAASILEAMQRLEVCTQAPGRWKTA